MKENIYTIKRLCKELNQPRQRVRRRIESLDIKAINENSRPYSNTPLEYDYEAFLKLAKEFNVEINELDCTTTVQQMYNDCTESVQRNEAEESSKDKLIKVLESQLEESNRSRERLERLLDQQQQLNLISNSKIEALRLELEKKPEENYKSNKKHKWYEFWK